MKIDGAKVVQKWLKDIEDREKDYPTYRYRGLHKDGVLIESNNIDDFKLQDFIWFEETAEMTEEMLNKLKVTPHYQLN